jgi:hypothetical protein
MTALTLDQAMQNIYTSLNNSNEDIDAHIIQLKIALFALGMKSVEVDPAKIAENNRAGRKLMQSYFRKRGVTVTFPEATQPAP